MAKKKECCSGVQEKVGEDHRGQLSRVNRIRGQIEGVGRMIEQGVYCPDIITQIQAARSALGALQAAVLTSHLRGCVRKSVLAGNDAEVEQLVQELVVIFKRA